MINDLLYNNLNVFGDLTAKSINTDSIFLSGYDFVKKSDEIYNIVSQNSGNNWDYQGTDIKSLTGNWEGSYTLLSAFSSFWSGGTTFIQNLIWDENTKLLEITTGNIVSLSSIYQDSKNYSDVNFLPLSGGTITGLISTDSGTSSNWDSVYGSVNSLSSNWDSVYNSVSPASSDWDSVYNSVNPVSSNWDSVYSSVSITSSNWDSVYNSVNPVSSNWDSVYSSVNITSSNWDSVYNSVNPVSSNWDSVYSSVNQVSSDWDSVYGSVNSLSSNWDDSTTIVQNNSSFWDYYKYSFKGSFNYSSSFPPAYTLQNIVINDKVVFDDFSNPINVSDGNIYICIKELPDIYGTPAPINENGINQSEYWKLIEIDSMLFKTISSLSTVINLISSNWDSVYSSVNITSSNWDNVYSSVLNTSANWDSVYSSTNTTSSNWDSVYSTVQINSSNNWDASISNNYTHFNFLPLSGGIITDNVLFNKNVTIYGDLSCSGIQTFANTVFSTTSALSVVHIGSGPAMWVGNIGTGDIASFYDIDENIEILHVGGNNGTFPNVGVKTSSPNADFTVNGSISSNNIIYDSNGNSDNWNSVYSSVLNTSANWDSVYSSVINTSANWDSVYTNINNVSSSWDSVYSNVNTTSANWDSVYSSVLNTSANWDSVYTNINNVSSSWDSVYSNVNTTSANWDSVYSNVNTTSANWDSVYSSVLNTSANWDSVYSNVNNVSSGWESVYSSVLNTSANWDSVYSEYNQNSALYATTEFANNKFLPLSGGTISGNLYVLSSIEIGLNNLITTLYIDDEKVGINTETPNVELTVNGSISSNNTIFDNNGNSDEWNSVYTSVTNTSANWQSVYTTVQEKSATEWNVSLLSQFVNSNYFPLSGGTITGDISSSGYIYADSTILTNANIQTFTNPATATGNFLILNINGSNKAIRLWDFTN